MNKLTHLFLALLMLVTVALSSSQPADAKNWNRGKACKTGWNKGGSCNKGWNKGNKTGWNKSGYGSKEAWRNNKKQGNYYQKQSQFAKSHNGTSSREAKRLNNKYRKAF